MTAKKLVSRRGRPLRYGNCSECGVAFETWLPQKETCQSRACVVSRRRRFGSVATKARRRLEARRDRVCEICESIYTPKNSSAKHCSDSCANYASRLRKEFGVEAAEYRELIARADGKCEGCGDPFPGHKRPSLDHCHATGKIRGLLCHFCNMSLGSMRDDLEIAFGLSVYLERSRFDLRDLCVK